MQIQKSFEQEQKQINNKIQDAQDNWGQTEIRDAMIQKAQLYNKWNKHQLSIDTYLAALKKTIEIGKKLDINFKLITIYLKLQNINKVKDNIDQCHDLLEKGGDWERKNKLKVYQGIYNLIIRNFSEASQLFVSVLPTFNCPQIMTYQLLVTYSVLTGIISMDRKNIKKKIIQSSQAIVYLMNLNQVKNYLQNFYYCHYKQFFVNFLWVIEFIKNDQYLKNHLKYFIRETRVVVYSQFLQSYKTVHLQSMAQQFGVSVHFMDWELSELISARRLRCKIDKVNGIIQTDLTDQRSRYYKTAIKKGDHLLNQIQKLSRAIDV